MLAKINLVAAAILFSIFITGCGGGETTTTANVNQDPSPNSPAPNNPPAPSPDNGGTGSASLSWFPPTTYTDGSSFTDLAGHHIYMDDGTGFVKVGTLTSAGISDYLVQNLANGTYTFVVTAYDSQGVESSFSNEATVTISS